MEAISLIGTLHSLGALMSKNWIDNEWVKAETCFYKILLNFSHFYTLLFHSLFKVEFDIDHFVLGEHRER